MRDLLWMMLRYGVRNTLRYERERRRREAVYGPFVPHVHGEGLLRAIGASDAQVTEAKRRGLA